jgi:23S rRNA pseudouridine2457 synthase
MVGMKSFVYLAFHKPFGVLSSFTDPEGRDTLKNYIDVPGVYSAGRLDYGSEGLLLLTDDGALINRLTDPRHHQPKTYLVQVEGVVGPEALAGLEKGVTIQGWKTRPARVLQVPEPEMAERARPITPHGPTAWLRMTITEGKKRQVRHMTAAVGLPTLRLVRVAIGAVSLGELKPGEWRYLTKDEVDSLRKG